MIEGNIAPVGRHGDGHPCVPIRVRGANRAGPPLEVQAMVDTGFSGYLVLPENLIGEIGAAPGGFDEYQIGDGSYAEFTTYQGFVEWNGQELEAPILLADFMPVVGMSLLWGLRLTVEAWDGGRVFIG